jgi:hypothetical protein
VSLTERTGRRSLCYSGWHRPDSTGRYVGRRAASDMTMIDVDACEYCCRCREPLALIETQESLGVPKWAPVMQRLAELAGIPAFSISVAVDHSCQPSERCLCDPVSFRVARLSPLHADLGTLDPAGMARFLLSLRGDHACREAG